MEVPPKGYHRLYIGNEIRLKTAYYVTATSCEKDADGNVTVVHCTYNPESRGGETADGRKVKGTSHWVSAKYAISGEVRLYDKLFKTEYPGGETGNYLDDLNPDSLIVVNDAKLEPSVADSKPGDYLQFIRSGYFTPTMTALPSTWCSTAPSRSRIHGPSKKPRWDCKKHCQQSDSANQNYRLLTDSSISTESSPKHCRLHVEGYTRAEMGAQTLAH